MVEVMITRRIFASSVIEKTNVDYFIASFVFTLMNLNEK
ncbi:hypothetical protein EMGBS15_10430 [Filimonas sp.]|nr:hypothetical protein EMGBS15_10430 [Filimonas sp.]